MSGYWATGANTKKVEDVAAGFFIEYNSGINMWRINHDKYVPNVLMGYSPHLRVLRRDINNFRKKAKKCN